MKTKIKRVNQNCELICDNCLKPFSVTYKSWVCRRESKRNRGVNHYCCLDCRLKGKGHNRIPLVKVNCNKCGKEFERKETEFEKYKTHFCSNKCNMQVVSKIGRKSCHTGKHRSWLEIHVEEILTSEYPNLEILFNKRDIIGLEGLELDIYIPSLKLAFELNGIFHYERIFSKDGLDKTQERDGRKFQYCIASKISLCVIDTSSHKHPTPKSSKKYLDIITSIIDENLRLKDGGTT